MEVEKLDTDKIGIYDCGDCVEVVLFNLNGKPSTNRFDFKEVTELIRVLLGWRSSRLSLSVDQMQAEKMARQDFEFRGYMNTVPDKWPDYLTGWVEGYAGNAPSKSAVGTVWYNQGKLDGFAVFEGRDVNPDRRELPEV